MPVFSESDISYLVNHPDVLKTKLKLDNLKQVYFSISLTPSLKAALKQQFGLNLDWVPMRWIKGDTPEHIDNGTKESGTYLVYLTDSPGKLTIGGNNFEIKKNHGYHFNENIPHSTSGTGNSTRLVMGPMNELGESVGGYVINYFSNYTDALNNNLVNAIASGGSTILGNNIYSGSINGFTTWKVITFNNPAPDGTLNPGVYNNGTDISSLIGPYNMSVYPAGVPCFLGATKILTDHGEECIEELQKGDLVKTVNGFVPVYGIGSRKTHNQANETRIKDQLYLCSKSIYPDLNENLVITGSHSLLVDKLPVDAVKDTEELLGQIMSTEGKFRLPVCLDNRSVVYPYQGDFTVYHVCLENENENMNYGIYANGLLVESICLAHYRSQF